MDFEMNSSKGLDVQLEENSEKFLLLDGLIQEGYGYELAEKYETAVTVWSESLQLVQEHMGEEGIMEIGVFDRMFNGTQSIMNWLQDYGNTLRYTLKKLDALEDRKTLGQKALDLFDFILRDQSLDINTMMNAQRDKAMILYSIDEMRLGEGIYQQMIRDYPDYVWGYIGYSDEYWKNPFVDTDYEKAFSILNQGYKRSTLTKDVDVLFERMAALQNQYETKALASYLLERDYPKVEEGSDITKIIAEIAQTKGKLPYPQMAYVNRHKEEALPLLLAELNQYVENPEAYLDRHEFLDLYVFMMMGQWEVKEALGQLLALTADSEEAVERRFGDALTESIPIVIYKCLGEGIEEIKKCMVNPEVYLYSKIALLKVISVYYVKDLYEIEAYGHYLEMLLEQEPELATWIACEILDHRLDQLLDLAKKCLESPYYDSSVAGDYSEYIEQLEEKPVDIFEAYSEPFDVFYELSSWASFKEDRPGIVGEHLAYIRYEYNRKLFYDPEKEVSSDKRLKNNQTNISNKVGRNDPCPCGSGNKYKRCCGR